MHIGQLRTKMRKLDMVAAKLNTIPRFQPFVNSSNISERSTTRMKVFAQVRNANEQASRVSYELSMSEFLLEKTKLVHGGTWGLKHV